MSAAAEPSVELSLAELLNDALFVDGDWVESKDQDPSGDVRLIQLADVGDGVFRDRSSRFLTSAKARELRCTFLEPGDILVARMPEPLGRACIFPGVGQPAVTVVDVCVIRPNPERVRPDWLLSAINSPSFRSDMQKFVRGTTRQRISRKNLGTLRLRIPGLGEQAAIVESLGQIQGHELSAAGHLGVARGVVERFRRAVLAAGCSGRLTADWRERRQLERPQMPNGGARRPKQLQSLGALDLEEIPEEWRWVQVNDLLPEGGIFDGPFGSNLKSSDYTDSGARVVRLENIGHLKFIGAKRTYVSEEKFRSLAKHAVFPGDIVFSSFVDDRTRVCVLPSDLDKMTLAKADCFTLRPTPVVERSYLALQLASHRSYGLLVSHIHGATRPRVNTTQVRGLPVPLCSLEEQREIARRVDELLQLADGLVSRIDAAAGRVDRSTQAVLSRALRGELVGGHA